MKHLKDILNQEIQEGLKLGSSKIKNYTEHPETKEELRRIIKKRLKKDKDADLNDIDVSKITNMSYLFYELDPHNIKIDQWDVSNVWSMGLMFELCKNFNADLSKWDVKNVEIMEYMFYRCGKFNSDLSNWNVKKVQDMDEMFTGTPLEKNLPKWFKKS